jgi:hypothetical protein
MDDRLDMPRGLVVAAIVGWGLTYVSDVIPPLLAYGDTDVIGIKLTLFVIVGLPIALFIALTAAWPLWSLLDKRGIGGARAAATAGAAFAGSLSLLQHAIWATFVWLTALDENAFADISEYGHRVLIDGRPTLFGWALAAGDIAVNACIGAVTGLVALRYARPRPQPPAASAGLS